MDQFIQKRAALNKRTLPYSISDSKPERVFRNGKERLLLSPPPIYAPKLYKTPVSTSRFAVLARIVKYLQTRHQAKLYHPLTLDEILLRTDQTAAKKTLRKWLAEEALPNNPKIAMTGEGARFSFKSAHNITDAETLMRKLKDNADRGLGGLLWDDVKESLFNSDSILAQMSAHVIVVIRPSDRKKVLFYNEGAMNFRVDMKVQNLWHSTNISGVSETRMERYLSTRGLCPMQGNTEIIPVLKRKIPSRIINQKRRLKNNRHLSEILEDYDNSMIF